MGDALVDAFCQAVLVCQHHKVDVGVISQQEQDATQQELIVQVAALQSFDRFGCILEIDEYLS